MVECNKAASAKVFWRLDRVSDAELEQELRQLLTIGANTEAHVVAHLAEVEARRLHLRAGYRSLFEYCLVALAFSEFEAVFRIGAARVAAKYPLAFELLERRELHLSGVFLLRGYLTPENHAELLTASRFKTKRQIEELIAERFPRADVPNTLRKLPTLEPLSLGRYRLELTVDESFKQQLELARDLLSHANPSGDFSVVLARGLQLLNEHLQKRRFGKLKDPAVKIDTACVTAGQSTTPIVPPESPHAAAPPSVAVPTEGGASPRVPSLLAVSSVVVQSPSAIGTTPSRGKASRVGPRLHIPLAVIGQIAQRDEYCCTFIGIGRRRCCARALLQVHHEQAWARGGADTPENLRLLCAEHNRLLAERDFGKSHMLRVTTERRVPRSDKVAGRAPPFERVSDETSRPPNTIAEDAFTLVRKAEEKARAVPDKVA